MPGSAGPLREGKATEFEGGVREPCVMCWPEHIPAVSVCHEPVMTIDLLPTLARLAGCQLPQHKIDGLDIWRLMSAQPDAESPHDALYFYLDHQLQAVRSGRWKLHFPHPFRSLAGPPGQDGEPWRDEHGTIGLSLFDLQQDIGETTNVADEHPDVVARLTALADRVREDLGNSATGQPGQGVRPAGKL